MRSLYGVIGMLVEMPLLFSKIWCVACSFNDVQIGYLLFIKSTLTRGVFARAGLCVSLVARFLHVENTFVPTCEENWENLYK